MICPDCKVKATYHGYRKDIAYYSCPKCGKIIEGKADWFERDFMGKRIPEIL